MKKSLLLMTLLSLVVGTGFSCSLMAQQGEWTEQYDQRFLNRDPKLNTEAPAVSAFDAEGKPFDLANTRGKHTVIVFGCMT